MTVTPSELQMAEWVTDILDGANNVDGGARARLSAAQITAIETAAEGVINDAMSQAAVATELALNS